MARVWILDTETKGTGAEMVPLEKAQRKPGPARGPVVVRPKPEPRPPEATGPKPAPRFKVVDVLSDQVLLEDASTRETLDLLATRRSLVDVRVYVRDDEPDGWRRLTLGEHKALWGLREAPR